MRKLISISALALLGAAGCSEDGPRSGPSRVTGGQGQLKISVAPLEAGEAIGNACYDIEVRGPKGALLWSASDICSADWAGGDTGGIFYVGVCDASGTAQNQVRISLKSMWDGDGMAPGNWQTPPAWQDDVTCKANGDTAVNAKFVVLRQGEKGFLDVSTTIDSAECNAKVDCQPDLLAGADGERGATVVVGLACDAGEGSFTNLYMDDIELVCTDASGAQVTKVVDPSTGPGLSGDGSDFVFDSMNNFGALAGGLTTFWTVAIAVEEGWSDCSLRTRMTASDDGGLAAYQQYPVIVADGVTFGWGDDGVFACSHPLGDDEDGVHIEWFDDSDLDFDWCLTQDEAGRNGVAVGPCPDLPDDGDDGDPDDDADTVGGDTGSTDEDTGPGDTGSEDTGPADTGSEDTGPADTGAEDSGPTDTGPEDTGTAGDVDPGPIEDPDDEYHEAVPRDPTDGTIEWTDRIGGNPDPDGYIDHTDMTAFDVPEDGTVVTISTTRNAPFYGVGRNYRWRIEDENHIIIREGQIGAASSLMAELAAGGYFFIVDAEEPMGTQYYGVRLDL